ncbi:hypothetical protein Y032_0012g1713 [Ancylostoma ceylanicum]|uniref:Uncharacterized protein n=1 Tax=Ancylostoma ceylanicum TaxID=53326 RepID=A0A016VDN9_9BILA|nr:hypothetical protein Y032_0012g1713 [Ancylostoma ceylanicum]
MELLMFNDQQINFAEQILSMNFIGYQSDVTADANCSPIQRDRLVPLGSATGEVRGAKEGARKRHGFLRLRSQGYDRPESEDLPLIAARGADPDQPKVGCT